MAAARTPTVYQENVGSANLYVAKIANDCVAGDTWVSGLKNIEYFWAQACGTGGTQAAAGINVSLSGTTFTFRPGFDTQTVFLFVLCDSD